MRLQGPGVPAPGVAAAPVGAPMGSEANVMGKTPKGPDLVVSVARFGTLIPKQVKQGGFSPTQDFAGLFPADLGLSKFPMNLCRIMRMSALLHVQQPAKRIFPGAPCHLLPSTSLESFPNMLILPGWAAMSFPLGAPSNSPANKTPPASACTLATVSCQH